MSEVNFLEGITQRRVKTDRLEIAYLETGPADGVPVVLLHGNVSCGWFFEDLMLALAGQGNYRVYAPDMRGYGDSETLPVDATRGVQDFSDDLYSFVQAVGLGQFHLLGWSLGGNVVMQYAIEHGETLRSLVLEAAGSPFGFGGTQGLDGKPNYPDFAGSGGGMANPDFVQRLKDGDRGSEAPNSPRNVMNAFYFKPPFKADAAREETYVSAMLSTKVTPENYPGDSVPSENWPNLGPGRFGPNNTISPKYLNQAGFANISARPEVLWIYGADDQIVGDNSFFDMGTLGKLGFVPGWPGEEVFPPQPMVSQLRQVLQQYEANGGKFTEARLADCGHAPHIEKAGEVTRLLLDFFGSH